MSEQAKPKRKPYAKRGNPLDSLDPRRQAYIQGILAGKTKKQAALDAGFSLSIAVRPQFIENPDAKLAFQEIIRAAIPPELIAKRIREGLDAEETKLFAKDGIIQDERNLIAWSERRETAKLAATLASYFNNDAQAQQTTVNVDISALPRPKFDGEKS